jgi:hypothetical protein
MTSRAPNLSSNSSPTRSAYFSTAMMTMLPVPIVAVPSVALVANWISRATRAAPTFQQLCVTLAYRTAGSCISSRVLKLSAFDNSTG